MINAALLEALAPRTNLYTNAASADQTSADQAVRVRHVKIERTRRRDSQNDSHFFKPEEDERRPQKVEQLNRDKQNP